MTQIHQACWCRVVQRQGEIEELCAELIGLVLTNRAPAVELIIGQSQYTANGARSRRPI